MKKLTDYITDYLPELSVIVLLLGIIMILAAVVHQQSIQLHEAQAIVQEKVVACQKLMDEGWFVPRKKEK